MLTRRVVLELRDARVAAGVSQRTLANELGVSQATVWRTEDSDSPDVTLMRLSEMASVLGYELSVGLHPIGDPVRDKAQLAIGRRFQALVSDAWRVTDETLLPGAGERRAWDKLLRLVGAGKRHLVGVDIESRVWDVQALVRRTRARERDGGVDAILIVLSDSATNRRIVETLRQALGAPYQTSPRALLTALRKGEPLRASGVILI